MSLKPVDLIPIPEETARIAFHFYLLRALQFISPLSRDFIPSINVSASFLVLAPMGALFPALLIYRRRDLGLHPMLSFNFLLIVAAFR